MNHSTQGGGEGPNGAPHKPVAVPPFDWRISNCNEPKFFGGRQSCPVCWGKGRWPAISDRAWARSGLNAKPDYERKCPHCRGKGHIKPIDYIAQRKADAEDDGTPNHA